MKLSSSLLYQHKGFILSILYFKFRELQQHIHPFSGFRLVPTTSNDRRFLGVRKKDFILSNMSETRVTQIMRWNQDNAWIPCNFFSLHWNRNIVSLMVRSIVIAWSGALSSWKFELEESFGNGCSYWVVCRRPLQILTNRTKSSIIKQKRRQRARGRRSRLKVGVVKIDL